MNEPPFTSGEGQQPPDVEHDDRHHWSPLQFSLRWVLVAICICAYLFTWLRAYGLEALFWLVIIVLFSGIVLGCIRIVQLPKRPHDE